jgi:hypothetical protein
MAKLSSKQRNKLPAKTFAGPGRSFPIPDKSHARAALQDSPKAVKSGKITTAEKGKIDARARAILRGK